MGEHHIGMPRQSEIDLYTINLLCLFSDRAAFPAIGTLKNPVGLRNALDEVVDRIQNRPGQIELFGRSLELVPPAFRLAFGEWIKDFGTNGFNLWFNNNLARHSEVEQTIPALGRVVKKSVLYIMKYMTPAEIASIDWGDVFESDYLIVRERRNGLVHPFYAKIFGELQIAALACYMEDADPLMISLHLRPPNSD